MTWVIFGVVGMAGLMIVVMVVKIVLRAVKRRMDSGTAKDQSNPETEKERFKSE
jgi:hypothetical protein